MAPATSTRYALGPASAKGGPDYLHFTLINPNRKGTRHDSKKWPTVRAPTSIRIGKFPKQYRIFPPQKAKPPAKKRTFAVAGILI